MPPKINQVPLKSEVGRPIGIAPEQQKLVFNAFEQADSSITRKFGGTGLGLAISSQLVEMMGGRIWVESAVGQGTTFHFTGVFDVGTEKAVGPPIEMASLAGLPVLIVDDNRTNRSLHGLTRALLNNMVTGVSEGFLKQLNIVGVGYKVELKGKDLVMQLGFSHPVNYSAPKGIEFEVDSKANTIKIKGIDKQQVGQVTAEIRKFRPPEPYKGKGVMYADERIRRKAGKTAGTIGA